MNNTASSVIRIIWLFRHCDYDYVYVQSAATAAAAVAGAVYCSSLLVLLWLLLDAVDRRGTPATRGCSSHEQQ